MSTSDAQAIRVQRLIARARHKQLLYALKGQHEASLRNHTRAIRLRRWTQENFGLPSALRV